MNLETFIIRTRKKLNDSFSSGTVTEGNNQRWKNWEIIDSLNRGIIDWVSRTRTNVSTTTIPLVINVPEYTIENSDRILRATWDGDLIPMKSWKEMDAFRGLGWEKEVGSGVRAIVTGLDGRSRIRVYPYPDALENVNPHATDEDFYEEDDLIYDEAGTGLSFTETVSGKLKIWYVDMPLEIDPEMDDNDYQGTTIPVDDQYIYALRDYVLSDLLADDTDGEDTKRAQIYRSKYEVELEKIRGEQEEFYSSKSNLTIHHYI